MLRKKSKVLSGLLTAALVLGTMCVPAFATETSDISLDNIEYDYIIDSVDDLFALEEDKFLKVPLKDYQNYLKKMRNPRVRQTLENRIHNILLISETQKEKRITL